MIGLGVSGPKKNQQQQHTVAPLLSPFPHSHLAAPPPARRIGRQERRIICARWGPIGGEAGVHTQVMGVGVLRGSPEVKKKSFFVLPKIENIVIFRRKKIDKNRLLFFCAGI